MSILWDADGLCKCFGFRDTATATWNCVIKLDVVTQMEQEGNLKQSDVFTLAMAVAMPLSEAEVLTRMNIVPSKLHAICDDALLKFLSFKFLPQKEPPN